MSKCFWPSRNVARPHLAVISMNAPPVGIVPSPSCRNRHCPKCQAGARERWLEKRRRELLPTSYVHVVFTLPRHLAPLVLQNKKFIYDLPPVRKRFWKLRVIPSISVQKLASSPSCIPGVKNYNLTPMCISSFRPVDYLPITPAGSNHATISFFPSECSAPFFAASSTKLSNALFRMAGSTSTEA